MKRFKIVSITFWASAKNRFRNYLIFFIESAAMAALAFAFIISFFGIGMGVILLKGTNQVSMTRRSY